MILSQLLWYHWLIIGGSIFVGISLLFGVWIVVETARRVYLHTLSRKKAGGWGRVCSAPDNPEQMKMWNDGIEYMKQFEDKKEELWIENDGLKLYAEFFNFGHKKTVAFLCGRCECSIYAYYYAKPYIESGLNVLFIDQRSHGFSEGEYSTVGIKESKDLLAWLHYLNNEKGQEGFILHCVCVGACSGTLAINSPDNPGFIEKIVADGIFLNFKESYSRHYCDLGHKKFPVYYLIWMWFKIYTGVSVKLSSPYDNVAKFNIPMLFIHTKNDKFSIPENAQKVFDHCASEKKYLVWFEEGTHSHIRNNATEKYDQTIKDFLTNN